MNRNFSNDQRLKELRDLPEGWLDGVGSPISVESLSKVELLLSQLRECNKPAPCISPTEDGGIQLDWIQDNRNIILTIDSSGHPSLFSFHLEDDGDPDVEKLGSEAIAFAFSNLKDQAND